MPAPLPVASATPRLRIAVARDRAFGFYYADDLDALTRAGADLVFFDTLHDAHLPACDGLLIGGGFPESFLPELAANASLRSEIATAIANGLPTYAECGGLMYLASTIRDLGGKRFDMVGAISGHVSMQAKPVGRGYVVLEPTPAHPWREDCLDSAAADSAFRANLPPLKAHEFHYSLLHDLPAETRYAYTVKRGHGIDGDHDGIVVGNLLASYTHLRATMGCDWPAKFLASIRRCQRATINKETIACLP